MNLVLKQLHCLLADLKKEAGVERTGGHQRRERKNFLRVKLKKKKKKRKKKKKSQSGERKRTGKSSKRR